MPIRDKIAAALASKEDIKAALTERGRTPSDVLSTYGDEIRAIAAGTPADAASKLDAATLQGLDVLGDDASGDDKLAMLNRLIRAVCQMSGKTIAIAALAFAPLLTSAGGDLSVSSARLGLLSNRSTVVTNVAESVRQYAMFVVPLNEDDASGLSLSGSWSGFELKGSTNNFDRALSESDRLVFWCQSDANQTGAYDCDDMRLFVVGGSGEGGAVDLRSYKRVSSTMSLGLGQNVIPRSIVCIVEVAGLKHRPDGGWLRHDNDELVWSYVRTKADSMERNRHGGVAWSPIAPVKWFSALPKWAEQ